jgi:hypothetical protein
MSSTLIKEEMMLLQAALFLNVSPQYLAHLLRQGKVTLDGLAAYKQERQKLSQQALQQLADQAQELNMGY